MKMKGLQILHKNFEDLTGKTFGRLTMVEYMGQKNNKSSWRCICVCGTEKVVSKDKIKSGGTVSCGCYAREWLKTNKPNCLGHQVSLHGKSNTKEYKAWSSAKDRCFNPKTKNWHIYGGRGITMYQPWADSFEEFFKYIGNAPSKKHSIDRIDNDGNYEPGNVRWATQEEQCNNKTKNIFVEIDGVNKSVTAWCKERGLSHGTIFRRISKGMSPFDAINKPIDLSKRRTPL